MSVLLYRNQLDEEAKKRICEELTIIIDVGSRLHKSSKIIRCFKVEKETVNVPLYYSVSILDFANDELGHLRTTASFIGELKDKQPETVNEGLNKLANDRAFTLVASTGSGKTVMGTWFGCKLKCVTCILIDAKSLIPQWEKTILDFTDGTYWIVDDKVPEELPDFIICMVKRVTKIPERIRKEISLLIIDEAHKFCTAKRVLDMMYFTPIYLIAMTATPNTAAFDIIHKFSGDLYVKLIINKEITVFTIKTSLEYSRVINEKTKELDWSVMDYELHFNPTRNAMLINLVMSNLDKKILILSGRIDHVDLVVTALKRLKVSCDYMSGNKSSYSDSNVLVGTSSKIGTGFDEATFCPDFSGRKIDTIIIFNSYKNLSKLEQNIGRSRHEFPVIYHFVDKDPVIYRQWLSLRKFYLDPESSVTAKIINHKVEIKYNWPFDENGNSIAKTRKIKIVRTAAN